MINLQNCVVVDVPENYHKCAEIVGDLIASDTFSFRWHVVRHVVPRLECFGLTFDRLIFRPSSCLKRWQKFNKNTPYVMPDCESEKDASGCGWPKGIFNFLSLSTHKRRKTRQIHLRRRIVIEISVKWRKYDQMRGCCWSGQLHDSRARFRHSIFRHRLFFQNIQSIPHRTQPISFSTVIKLSQAPLKLSRPFRFHLPL